LILQNCRNERTFERGVRGIEGQEPFDIPRSCPSVPCEKNPPSVVSRLFLCHGVPSGVSVTPNNVFDTNIVALYDGSNANISIKRYVAADVCSPCRCAC